MSIEVRGKWIGGEGTHLHSFWSSSSFLLATASSLSYCSCVYSRLGKFDGAASIGRPTFITCSYFSLRAWNLDERHIQHLVTITPFDNSLFLVSHHPLCRGCLQTFFESFSESTRPCTYRRRALAALRIHPVPRPVLCSRCSRCIRPGLFRMLHATWRCFHAHEGCRVVAGGGSACSNS